MTTKGNYAVEGIKCCSGMVYKACECAGDARWDDYYSFSIAATSDVTITIALGDGNQVQMGIIRDLEPGDYVIKVQGHDSSVVTGHDIIMERTEL